MKDYRADNSPLSVKQIDAIIDILLHQCSLIVQRENNDQKKYPELYDEDYMRGRKHSYTASVLAGFQESTIIPDMVVTKRQYGLFHCQPELSSDTAVVQLYSDEATLKNDEIKKKCQEFNSTASGKRYLIMQFSLSKKGNLHKVDIVDLDGDAKEISRQTIYKQISKIVQISA